MEEDELNKKLNKSKENSIAKFSNDLVRRSIEDLTKIYSGSTLLIKNPKILLVAENDFGNFLKSTLQSINYEINILESRNQLDVIYLELSQVQYEIIVLSNTTMSDVDIITILPEIKKRFPLIRIIVLSSESREEYVQELYDLKVDSFLKTPFETNSLITKITNQIPPPDETLTIKENKISSTKKTPEVLIDQNGIIQIKGKLIPENASEFFERLENWINEKFSNPLNILSINIKLDYINGDSTAYFLKLLKRLSYTHLKKKRITINWYYSADNEDIYEKGKQFSSVIDIPFNFIITK